MKKSKFLRSSKEMLSRGFNPSKCKTSLRLASSRLKLMRNKKEAQVKQIRREISLLLESGQDQTARMRTGLSGESGIYWVHLDPVLPPSNLFWIAIRLYAEKSDMIRSQYNFCRDSIHLVELTYKKVEHVIREEKLVTAFELIGIYCELIVARLPIIESQKICPIDLKEAITSLVFASLRCSDIPELAEIKKHFTDKYGKDFITAAVEIRPDCGVSRMLVEKLSVVATDVQTKTKILTAIADEHNVKWDAKSFENSAPADDLLSGRTSFVKESERHFEPSHSQGSDIKAPQSNQLHDSTLNFTQVSGYYTSFQHEEKQQALGGERAQLFRGDSSSIPHNRQRWNMEFKDATSAAQAAAESAEIASMAARAAAELSSRGSITRQYSTESCYSDHHSLRDDAHDTDMRSKLGSEQSPRDSNSRLQNEQLDRRNLNNTGRRFEAGREEFSDSSSLKSKASSDDDSADLYSPVVDRYSPKNSSTEVSRGKKSMQRQPFKYQAEIRVEKAENTIEEMTRKQERSTSSHSHSSISNNLNSFSNAKDQDFDYHGGESSFNASGKRETHEDSSHKSSHGSAAVFDRYDSDIDDYGFNQSPTYDEPQQGLEPFSSRKTHEYFSTNSDTRSTESSSIKTAKSAGSQFKHESGSPYKGSPQHDQRQLSLSSDYVSEETSNERNQGEKFDVDHQPRFNLAIPSPHQPTFLPKKNRTELVDSSPEREDGLNFGKLTGGFRHKGHYYPSLGRNQFDSFPSNKESNTNMMLERKNTKPDVQSTSDTDSSEEEEEEDSSMRRSDKKHKLYNLTGGKHLNKKPSVAASNLKFGSENSDLDEDLPKESVRRTSSLLSGISRRTKAFPPNQEKEKYSGLKIKSEALDLDKGMDGKANTSTVSGTPKRYEIKKDSSKLENYKQHTFDSEVATSLRMQVSKAEIRSEAYGSHARMERKPTESYSAEPRQHLPFLKGNSQFSSSSKVATKPTNSYLHESLYRDSSARADSWTVQESNLSAKPSAIEGAALPQNKTETNLKTEILNKDSSNQKASHVHPKLPEYDSFVQFFQKNRS